MKIIKENFYTVVKLWINQFGAIFLAALLLLPTKILAENFKIEWLSLVVSLFTIIFYLMLIFWVCCELGLKDSVPIEMGRMKMKWYKGTVLALTARLPSILLCTIICILHLILPDASVITAILEIILAYVFNVMYYGTLSFTKTITITPIHYIIALISIAVCTAGYIAGTKGFLASLLSKKE